MYSKRDEGSDEPTKLRNRVRHNVSYRGGALNMQIPNTLTIYDHKLFENLVKHNKNEFSHI